MSAPVNPPRLVTVVLRGALLVGGQLREAGARLRLPQDVAETLLQKGRVTVWHCATG